MAKKRKRSALGKAQKPDPHSVSIRENISDSLGAFLEKERLPCAKTKEAVASLVAVLLDYKEEGQRLYPELFIFDDASTIFKILPNSENVSIGSGPKTGETLRLALKRCAPLAQWGWSIYVQRRIDTFEYGLLRCGLNSLSMTASELLIEQGEESLPVISVRHISQHKIEISGASQNSIQINFGAAEKPGHDPLEAAKKFCSSLVRQAPAGISSQMYNFYWRIFASLPRGGHGCLAAVVAEKKRVLPPHLRDGVEIIPHFDVSAKLLLLLKAQSCEADTRVRATAALIRGMLQTDGVTVFGADGAVWAYNVFLKAPRKAPAGKPLFGGARRRAFDILCSWIGTDLQSAFFLSQDGHAEFNGDSK